MSEIRSFAALRQPRFAGFALGVASVMMADAIETSMKSAMPACMIRRGS